MPDVSGLLAEPGTAVPAAAATVGAPGGDRAITRIAGVPVVHWNPIRSGAPVANFGDVLGPAIVSRLVGSSARTVAPDGPALLSVGSILHLAPERSVVWGSGVNGKMLAATKDIPDGVAFRAVRGPLSRRFLSGHGFDVPEVYGDPVLLLADVMPELLRVSRAPVRDVLFVPNFNDKDDVSAVAGDHVLETLDSQDHVDSVLLQIASSRFVISTSLHAVIVAEALGIPARFVRSAHEHPFKYRDYLAGTGRAFEPIAETVEEAFVLGGQPEPRFDADALLEAFPWELWSSGDETPWAAPERGRTDPDDRDRIWIAAMEDSRGAALDRARAEYEGLLRALTDEAGRTTGAAELADLRQWHYAEVAPDSLPAELRSVDAAVRTFSVARIEEAARRVRDGLRAVAYAAVSRPRGTVLSLALLLADTQTPIGEVRLTNEALGEHVAVPQHMLPPRTAQLDLDVVLPPAWGAPEAVRCLVSVRYDDGTVRTTELAWSEDLPRLAPEPVHVPPSTLVGAQEQER
ncbi:polysaccharide pyruvyl transferase family protein [Promicromonospora sp. NPDC023805]|uniref:polysaccharide pyruvyl transferase family protein n=1 Tax=Promicromonospora sp. NPDC023805 TaxID=3154696 RepID=UPI0033D48FFB